MKTNHRMMFRAAPLALGLALATMPVTPLLFAQQEQAPDAQHEQQKVQTFVGKIVRITNGQFALLTDETSGKGLYLDNQDKAKEFEGKMVKVTGVLEVAKNLVHVTDIERS
jgi:hypothetical protein